MDEHHLFLPLILMIAIILLHLALSTIPTWEVGLRQKHFKFKKTKNNGVCHTMALPFTFFLKKYLKAKEELWKLKYFSMQKYNLQKML